MEYGPLCSTTSDSRNEHCIRIQSNFYNIPRSPPPPDLGLSPFWPRPNPSRPPLELCPFVCLRRPFVEAFGFCCRLLFAFLFVWPSKLMPSNVPPSVSVNVPVKFVVVVSNVSANWLRMNAHETFFDDAFSAAPHSDN